MTKVPCAYTAVSSRAGVLSCVVVKSGSSSFPGVWWALGFVAVDELPRGQAEVVLENTAARLKTYGVPASPEAAGATCPLSSPKALV